MEPEEKEKIMELIKKNDPFEMRLKPISQDTSMNNKIKTCPALGWLVRLEIIWKWGTLWLVKTKPLAQCWLSLWSGPEVSTFSTRTEITSFTLVQIWGYIIIVNYGSAETLNLIAFVCIGKIVEEERVIMKTVKICETNKRKRCEIPEEALPSTILLWDSKRTGSKTDSII